MIKTQKDESDPRGIAFRMIDESFRARVARARKESVDRRDVA